MHSNTNTKNYTYDVDIHQEFSKDVSTYQSNSASPRMITSTFSPVLSALAKVIVLRCSAFVPSKEGSIAEDGWIVEICGTIAGLSAYNNVH